MDIESASDQENLVTEPSPSNNPQRKLDTFEGVFVPVCLAMFSAILFLRLGFVLGNSGLFETLLQLFIAYNILIYTILSVSAISTNGAIEGGGIYFMSSRVLGPEFGGAIGVLFFVANVVSSAFYITGCVEGILENFGPKGEMYSFLPDGRGLPLTYASILNLINLVICIFGAAIFAKATLVIFAVVFTVAISVILSLMFMPSQSIPIATKNHIFNITNTTQFTGMNWETFKSNLYPNYTYDYLVEGTTQPHTTSFAYVFGVLFTGVTGVLAGANISGDLKNPKKSIPIGTLSGIICTFSIYVILFLLSAASCSRELLQNNYLYMQYTNIWPPLVEIGISSATLSASLTNLIGASRLLNAVARDRLFGSLMDTVYKVNHKGNPIGSVVVTWLMIQLMLFMGSVNTIAQISSILFLFTYFSLNLSCMMCILTSAPNFRPLFKHFNLFTTVVGLTGAAGMTFVINPLYSSLVIIVWMAIMIGIHVRSPPLRWGHITQALIFHQVRKYLLLLDQRKEHVKFWRPRVLLMVANPRSSLPLIEFVNDLKKSGLFVIGHVQLGNLDDYEVDPVAQQYPIWLKWLDQIIVKAFIEITLAPTVRYGLHQIARIAGLGAMKLNTIVFGFYDESTPVDFLNQDHAHQQALEGVLLESGSSSQADMFRIRRNGRLSPQEYVGMVSDSMRKLNKSVCLARNFHQLDTKRLGQKDFGQFYIDVWPVNFFKPSDLADNTAHVMMQFACILNMVTKWKASTTIRLMICTSHQDQQRYFDRWQRKLEELRIDADLSIIVHARISESDIDRQDNNNETLLIGGEIESASKRTTIDGTDASWGQIDPDYVTSVNRMLVDQSEHTAVSFLYLPMAPKSPEYFDCYLEHLDKLTDNMPPTLLVHGHDQVVSTSL